MTKQEAIEFFREHSKWMKESWSMTPEGIKYQEKFEEALRGLIEENKESFEDCGCFRNLLQHQINCHLYAQHNPKFFDISVIKNPIDKSYLTTDPTDPRLGRGVDDKPVPQNEVYLVLSEEERAKGFVRPLRRSYKHVGERPKYSIRNLTIEEFERYKACNYIAYETYPKNLDSSMVGRYWTKEQLRSGCDQITTMGLELCETYARNPKFYRSTYCITCCKHLPVNEFIWTEDGERVGS